MKSARAQYFAAAAIAFVWAWSGIAKLVNWDEFVAALRGHGIVPEPLLRFDWLVPAFELTIAIAIAPSLKTINTAKWRRAAVYSVLAAGTVSYYAWSIPPSALAAVGCGCRGGVSHPITVAGIPARAALLLTDAAFICLHALLFVLPAAEQPQPPPVA